MDVKIAALRQSFRHLTARLRQDFKNRLAVVDVEPLASRHFKQPRVEAELVQDRGVDVGDVAPGLMLFVATRAVHSYVHLGSNNVRFRALSYFAGWIVIIAMWLVVAMNAHV